MALKIPRQKTFAELAREEEDKEHGPVALFAAALAAQVIAVVLVTMLIGADDSGILALGDDVYVRADDAGEFRSAFWSLALVAACACAAAANCVLLMIERSRRG